jgi:RNA polymerase sigma-70 factor (ECF subfamily)
MSASPDDAPADASPADASPADVDATDAADPLAADSEAAFRARVRPHTEMLLRAAEQDLDYYVAQGALHEQDLTPEEVVGEALIDAWAQRAARPEGMSAAGWLLACEVRAVRRLVDEHQRYRAAKALSLDERLPPDARAEGRQARQQYAQHDTAFTMEDVMPGTEPVDVEAPLFAHRDTFELDPDSRHVVMMHDEFDVPLPEVAATLERAMKDTAKLLEQARAHLRTRKPDAQTADPDLPPPRPTDAPDEASAAS